MPDVNTHCKISKDRTNKEFRELHEWIDEPQKFFGINHRLERHSLNDIYKKYIEENFGGKRAVIEWLFHIAIDNLETANKFAVDEYVDNFGEIKIVFNGKEIKGCDFKKNKSGVTTFFKK
ncbi:MAG: hypothetical protein V1889_02860 [archaeon]